MATFTAGAGVDFDTVDLGQLQVASTSGVTSTSVALVVADVSTQLYGDSFQFAGSGPPTAGLIHRIVVGDAAGMVFDINSLSQPATEFRNWILTGDNTTAKLALFAGDDIFTGSSLDDRMRGYAGADTLNGGAGADFLDGGDGADDVFGGAGHDTIVDFAGANYLRGEDGNDVLLGGVDFDDINGNVGNDTAQGGGGNDWVVGGKDNDVLFGDDGDDLVYGNLGNDTCTGGAGADTLRGGQANDSLAGGAGADFVSGDRGDDTMTGGSGADLFHSSADAGIDRVLDFSAAEGDRIFLDPGTTWTVSQVGGDTVVQMSAGQVVLVGVSMSSLLSTSIFAG
jgi:serralysin